MVDGFILNSAIGHVPFIRAPRGNAAEMVAKKLEVKIRDAILTASRSTNPSNALFAPDSTGLSSLQRPRTFKIFLYHSFLSLTSGDPSSADPRPQRRFDFHRLSWLDVPSSTLGLLLYEA